MKKYLLIVLFASIVPLATNAQGKLPQSSDFNWLKAYLHSHNDKELVQTPKRINSNDREAISVFYYPSTDTAHQEVIKISVYPFQNKGAESEKPWGFEINEDGSLYVPDPVEHNEKVPDILSILLKDDPFF
jgi:hypothetical protein